MGTVQLTKLEMLSLDETRVTDRGLAQLASLFRLKHLLLATTSVGDDGLAAWNISADFHARPERHTR